MHPPAAPPRAQVSQFTSAVAPLAPPCTPHAIRYGSAPFERTRDRPRPPTCCPAMPWAVVHGVRMMACRKKRNACMSRRALCGRGGAVACVPSHCSRRALHVGMLVCVARCPGHASQITPLSTTCTSAPCQGLPLLCLGPHGTLQESGGEAGSVKHGIFFGQTL